MPKKSFKYKLFADSADIWYTDSLKGWFIVKEENQYFLRKGSIINGNALQLGTKRFKVYQRLGDAKVGLENYCKDYVESLKKQQEIFNELQKDKDIQDKLNNQKNQINYSDLDKEVERLKEKWGIR